MAESKQFLDIEGTAVVASHIKDVDEKVDAISINTLILDTTPYVGGTYSVTGGDELYEGNIEGDSVELAIKEHNTDYQITISFKGTDYDASITTGTYFNHYVVDKFEEPPTPADTLDDTDWATISAIAQRGEASAYWAVGDVKGIELDYSFNSSYPISGTYYAFILGFDHNADLEGENTIHFQFGKTSDGTDIAFYSKRMNSSNTNVGGWEACEMRTTSLPDFFDSLPDDLQAVIKEATKYTDNVGNAAGSVASNVTATLDKLFLLAQYEVFASTSSINTYEADYQEQYDYYAAGNSRVKYRHSATGTACHWWLRSPIRSYATYFRFVITDGSSSYSIASSAYGVAPAFLI